jgi:hypothetical protein
MYMTLYRHTRTYIQSSPESDKAGASELLVFDAVSVLLLTWKIAQPLVPLRRPDVCVCVFVYEREREGWREREREGGRGRKREKTHTAGIEDELVVAKGFELALAHFLFHFFARVSNGIQNTYNGHTYPSVRVRVCSPASERPQERALTGLCTTR